MLFLFLAQEQTLRPVTRLSRLLARSAERLERWAVPRGYRPVPGVTPNGRRVSSGGTSPAGASAARRGSPPS